MMELSTAKIKDFYKLKQCLFLNFTWAIDKERKWRIRPSRNSGTVWKTCLSCAGGNWRSNGNECGRVFWQHFIKPSHIRACFQA